ncbi:MAG: hypothetical protein Q8858_16955 [Bacteroidota bacterium]|nr:hypothetical protein [Bacteroidota bacterium]
MFKIEFVGNKNKKLKIGNLIIEDFQETFLSSLRYWTENEYIDHWYKSIEAVINGAEVTALITSMADPKDKRNVIFSWPIYRIKDDIYIQNRILFIKEIEKDFQEEFSLDNLDKYLSPRETFNEDGEKLSDWKTSVETLRSFIMGIK